MDNYTTSLASEQESYVYRDPMPTSDLTRNFYRIFGAIGVVGNVFTIIVMLSSAELRRKPINIFMIHQSCVDLTAITCVNLRMFINSMWYVRNWSLTFKRWYCQLWLPHWMHILLYGTSGYNLVAMSFERYQAIVKPFQYDEAKVKKRMPLLFLAVWLLPLALYGYMPIINEVVGHECIMYFYAGVLTHRILILMWGLIGLGLVPCIVTIGLHIRMGIAMRFGFKAAGEDGKKEVKALKLTPAQRNVFSTCAIMVVSFLTCWSCFMGITMLGAAKNGDMIGAAGDAFYVAEMLLEINCVVNPIIYSIRYKEFQNQAKRLFCGRAAA